MNKNAKLITLFFITIFISSFAYSITPQITITENASLTNRYRQALDIDAKGTLFIHNPSQIDEIYEFVLKFRNDANLQITISNTTNTSKRFFITSSKIYGREILANETIKLNYQIRGKTDYKHLSKIQSSSVINWYISEISLDPLRLITLEKLQRTNLSIPVSPRRVIVKGENPTDFNVNINYLTLFKIKAQNFSDISFTKENLHTITNLDLSPHQNFNIEILDNYSDDNTVYWVESDFRTVNNITNNFKYNLETKSGGSSTKKNSTIPNLETDYNLEIYKTAQADTIAQNETINITLIIQNPNNHPYTNLRIYEKIPSHFSIIPSENQTYEIKENSILFRFSKIEENSFSRLQYKLKLIDKISEEIIYISPATLEYDDKTIYSNGLTFLNKNYEEDRRIFVQKIIQTLDNQETKIIIKVKNIGNSNLREIGVIEDISTQIIKGYEITKQNEQAKWLIRELKIGEEWETSYKIGTKDANKYIPQITGIDDSKVYKTLIINEEIREYYDSEPGLILKFLAVFAIILLITDILF